MRPSALPRPVFDVKGWTTQSSPQSPGLSNDNGPFEILKDYILLRPRRLRFLRFLGAGSFGCVYLAVDLDQNSYFGTGGSFSSEWTADEPYSASGPETPRYYAVKCINNQRVSRRKRLREVNTHRAVLGHRGVLDLYACVQQDGWTFLVLEYAEGGDMLQCMLTLNPYTRSDVTIRSAFEQLVDAVHHCHRQGVFHRDIKPENIMCRKGGLEVALGDFGLATTEVTSADFGTGSKYFMSPECLKHGYLAYGERPEHWEPKPFDTAKNDIWCLGMLLCSVISQSTPWERANDTDDGFMLYLKRPLVLRDMLPISWAAFDLLHRMLDVNPQSRVSIPRLKHKFRDIHTFRMTPWELESASSSAQIGAGTWLPHDYVRPQPQPWTRYETYPEHLDTPRPLASQSPEVGPRRATQPKDWPCLWEVGSCGTAISEDIVPSLLSSRTSNRNQTSRPITPAAVDIADPLVPGGCILEIDLADGLEVYVDRLRIEKWISECADALDA